MILSGDHQGNVSTKNERSAPLMKQVADFREQQREQVIEPGVLK
jgi:hypothetical protein